MFGILSHNPSRKTYTIVVAVSMFWWFFSLVFGGLYMAFAADDFKERSEEMRIDIAPAPWAFQIWYFIYLWQLVFFIYSIFSIFDRYNLPKVPISVYCWYSIQVFFTVIGGVIATKFLQVLGFFCILGMTVSIYFCLIISLRRTKEQKSDAKSFLYTYAVDNGLAILAGWLSIATLLSMGIALIHENPHLSQQCGGKLVLGILMIELIAFCGLEMSILEKYLRYVWTHYIALVVACVGVLANNWNRRNDNFMMTVAISGFVLAAFVVKIMRMIFRKKYLTGKIVPQFQVVVEKVIMNEEKVPIP